MSPFSKFLMLILIFISIKVLNMLISPLQSRINNEFKQQRLKFGLISRFFLSNLNKYEFEDYCRNFLLHNGYNDIFSVSEDFNGGLSLVCTNFNGNRVYVSCIKSEQKKDNTDDIYSTVGIKELQKFVGLMLCDGVKEGIVITNGDFSNDAIKYADKLSQEYKIQLIDGISLSKDSWEIREKSFINVSLES